MAPARLAQMVPFQSETPPAKLVVAVIHVTTQMETASPALLELNFSTTLVPLAPTTTPSTQPAIISSARSAPTAKLALQPPDYA